jgi:hypothetical protein
MVELYVRYPIGLGRAVAQAVSRWLPTAAARVRARSGHVGFVVDKGHWGRFSLSTSVSLANHRSTKIFNITSRGSYNRLTGGRSAEWSQLKYTPYVFLE